MFKKIDIKWIAGIFVVLLLLVLVISPRKNNKNQRSFKSELIDIDTTKVSSITIKPAAKDALVVLERKNELWQVATDDGDFKADKQQVDYMLAALINLKANRLAANDKTRWSEFEVTDSSAIRVTVMEGKKITADIYIGKFNYQQPKNPNPYQQQQGTMSTYVRNVAEKEVYVVDGFLGMTFGREAKDLRDNKLAALNNRDLSKLSFKTPNGNFTLTKQGDNWLLDGLPTDSLTTANYLQQFINLSSREFLDKNDVSSSAPKYSLSIEGENIPAPVKIEAFAVADTNQVYAITSSENSGACFSGKKGGLFDKIFKSKSHFTMGQP